MAKPNKIDTAVIGLDVGLSFMRWLTGTEHLHYGLWDGLEPCAQNVGAAQTAYTNKLFSYLPEGPLKILDIGGGAGETAKRLIALGHDVEIVVPSPFLADRCRANAPDAKVHQSTFEAFDGSGPFDLCLFSESFQYIPYGPALEKAHNLVKPGGAILIADCFRSEAYQGIQRSQTVGGGHRLSDVRAALSGFEVIAEEDVTQSVAPSIDVEQALFHVIGHGVTRVDEELARNKPRTRWLLRQFAKLTLSERRRFRLMQRLTENRRTAEVFCEMNRYVIFSLRRPL